MNLTDSISNKKLREIAKKIETDTPVDKSDAISMLETDDILELGTIANHVRRKLHGNKVYYGVNMNLNYTNICELRCPLCAFSKDADDPDAYLLTINEIKEQVTKAVAAGVEEVHIVGGLYDQLKLSYFESILQTIKAIKPDMYIVAFSAVEYDYFARLNNLPIEEVFKRLMAAGLSALPGGGAEIFTPALREKLAPKKISGEKWLEIMGIAHGLGLKTNATMLYNHLETSADVADHLLSIRGQQEKTGGFKTFVPLPFHESNTEIRAKRRTSTGFDDIRIYASSRIVLHNIPHIKGLWMYVGEKMAQVLLSFGVDDIGATYFNEKVVHAAGAKTSTHGSEDFLVDIITSAGFAPVKTTAGYVYQERL